MLTTIKKVWFLIILTSLPTINIIAQSNKNLYKHKVKEIKQISYDVKEGNPPTIIEDAFSGKENNFINDYIVNEICFDEHKNIIKNIQYRNDNKATSKTTAYLRNKNNNVLQEVLKTNSNDEIEELNIYKYDDNENIIGIKTYNKKNELIKSKFKKYDAKKNNIETIFKNIIRGSTQKFTFTYNKNNLKIKQISYYNKGCLKNKWTYSYDKNGNEIERVLEKSDRSTTKTVSQYDQMNNILVETTNNNKGEIQIVDYMYTYDRNNNWIRKDQNSRGKHKSKIWFRKIEYYK